MPNSSLPGCKPASLEAIDHLHEDEDSLVLTHSLSTKEPFLQCVWPRCDGQQSWQSWQSQQSWQTHYHYHYRHWHACSMPPAGDLPRASASQGIDAPTRKVVGFHVEGATPSPGNVDSVAHRVLKSGSLSPVIIPPSFQVRPLSWSRCVPLICCPILMSYSVVL